MPRVESSPEELRSFASTLKQYNVDLSNRSAHLQALFHRLGDTWRDQEHARFAAEFEETMRVIARFLKVSEQQVPFLLAKAQRLEDYLSQR